MRLVGFAVPACVGRDHPAPRRDQRVDDARRHPVDAVVGGEPVEQQGVRSLTRDRVRDADPVEGCEAFHGGG